MKYNTILVFGAPGSGKGTQGKILGQIPGFFFLSCGDVFRSLDPASELGKTFVQYSSRGELVPDQLTVDMWKDHVDRNVKAGKFRPEKDILLLDGLPRNVQQAKMLNDSIQVQKILHLVCTDTAIMVDRITKRALKDHRTDDLNEKTILHRAGVYLKETKPVLECYDKNLIHDIEATRTPLEVLKQIVSKL